MSKNSKTRKPISTWLFKNAASLRLISIFIALSLVATNAAFSQTGSVTILVNGFASNIPTVGYGLENLSKKIPGSKVYSYFGAIEGLASIAPQVLRDVRHSVAENPEVEINLVGASFGANLLTRMVKTFENEGIQVHYLGVIDGLPLAAIPANVLKADNFYCTKVGCLKDRIKRMKGNTVTEVSEFRFSATHVGITNLQEVHARIIEQISTDEGEPVNLLPEIF